MLNQLFWIVPICSVIALLFAWFFFKGMMKESEGNETMKRIAGHVRKGAMAYLRQQYKIVGLVFLVLCLFFAWMAYGPGLQNGWVWFAFLTGGFFSGLAGFIGMKTATYASARTANAASRSMNDGLKVAFRSGAVMGLVVVGLALLDISLWWLVLDCFVEEASATHKAVMITTTMLTFGMGASTQALFARVGGGIFTKAADVGADLVGKVEAGIPEDDPRNPATIADNVGDNVGDVAGMGADLYESYCGSVLATAALGAAAFITVPELQFNAILAPMLIAAFGVILSLLGIFMVKTKEGASQLQLLRALDRGINTSSVLIVAATFLILWLLQLDNWIWISCAVVVGLLVGIVIGRSKDGKKAVTAYFIMGRSANSRNRVFVEDGEGIRTQAFDPSKLEDPSLIIYAPVRVLGNKTIVTNGDQTDTIYEMMDKQQTFEQALRTREFEPDAPNYTPRISGIMHIDKGEFNYAMSILKSNNGNPDACNRYTFAYSNPVAGEGHFIHTYMGDGNPLPSFEGEPTWVDIDGDIDTFTKMVWENLNEDNKVSLFVRFIDIETGNYESRIVNKNK